MTLPTTHTVTLKIELPDTFLDDVRTTATEGGIGYWSETLDYTWRYPNGRTVLVPLDVDETLDPATRTAVVDGQTGIVVDRDVIARGVGYLLDGTVRVGTYLLDMVTAGVRQGDAGEIDSDGADVIVQAGIFGKIIYG